MEQNKIEGMKERFVDLYMNQINREGDEALLDWLENETDFFQAPASAGHHLNYPGGLVEHSLNVYDNLLEIAANRDERRDTLETVTILALLHDVCKAGVYHPETKRRKNRETGEWEDYQVYTSRDPLPLGHGEKSLYLIARHMQLTDEEAMAIRWHMGAYDDAVKGGCRAMTEAMEQTPWVWRLHEADMCATWIDERGDG